MRQKSELEVWLDKYYEQFGENYPLDITNVLSNAENIANIKRCVKEKKIAESPKYEAEAVY